MNWGIRVLQTLALPLGYVAITIFYAGECRDVTGMRSGAAEKRRSCVERGSEADD